MPKLPFYDRTVKGEALNPAMVRAPGPSGLDALGAGIAKAGAAVTDIADKEIRQAEDTQINNFEVELDRVAGDIKRSLAERKGEAAFLPGEAGKPPPDEEARQALAATRERLLETLVPSNRAREMAAERSQRTLVRHTAEVDDYTAGQREVAFRASEDAARGMREQTLAREYDVPGRAAEIIGEAMRREKANAKSAEAGEAAAFEARKRLHGIVLDRYLDPVTGDAQKAHEYFATAKPELGTEARVYEAAVVGAVNKRKAASEADYLMEGAKAPMPEDSAQPLNEYDGSGYPDPVRVLDQLNLRPAGPETDALRREVYARLADTEKARKAQQAQQYGAALNEFQNNGFRTDKISPKLWASIQAHDYEGAAKLKAADADAREKEARLARAHAKGRGAGNAEAKRLAADQKRRNQLIMDDFNSRPADERATLDIMEEYGTSGADDLGLSALKPKQRDALDLVEKEGSAGEVEFRRVGLAAAAGFVKSKGEVKDFTARLTSDYADFRARNKRAPDREESRKMIDFLVTEQTTEKGWLFDTKKRGYELPRPEPKRPAPLEMDAVEVVGDPKAPVRMTVPGIDLSAASVPASDRAQIAAALKRAGRPVTEAAIAAAYAKRGNR